MCGVVFALCVGVAIFAAGVFSGRLWTERLPADWEVYPELRAELEPAFQEYLALGPLATGRLDLLGGSLPVELIDSTRGAYYCVVPLGRQGDGMPSRVWVVQSGVATLKNYRAGYYFVSLDPDLAFRVLDPPEGGTLWERPGTP